MNKLAAACAIGALTAGSAVAGGYEDVIVEADVVVVADPADSVPGWMIPVGVFVALIAVALGDQ